VDWFGRHRPTRTRTELLTPHLDGVVAFQELGPKIIPELRMLWGDRLILSTDVYDRAHPGWMACGIGTPAGSRVLATGVLSTLPKPQRSLWARLALPDGQVVTVVSWHTPNAAGDSRAVKMDAYQAMTDWLHDSHPERDRHPVVLSADLNTWHDPIGHPTPARTTFARPSSTSSASTPAIA